MKMPKRINSAAKKRSAGKAPCAAVSHETWLVKRLKDPAAAAAYVEAAIEGGDQAALLMALRHVAQARGGMSKIARK
jgi:DNA-binding phage protein